MQAVRRLPAFTSLGACQCSDVWCPAREQVHGHVVERARQRGKLELDVHHHRLRAPLLLMRACIPL